MGKNHGTSMLVICCVWKRGILDQLWDDEMFPTCSGTKTVISYHIPCSIPIMVTFISQLSLLWLVISIVSPSFHITIISITSYTSYNIYIYIHIITHITTLSLVLLHHWAFIRKHQIHSNPVLPCVSKPCTPSVHIKIAGLAGCSFSSFP